MIDFSSFVQQQVVIVIKGRLPDAALVWMVLHQTPGPVFALLISNRSTWLWWEICTVVSLIAVSCAFAGRASGGFSAHESSSLHAFFLHDFTRQFDG
jgi:hypothetical protein